jgi:adenylate cyclase
MKPALASLAVLLPLLSAAGFIRMMRMVEAKSVILATPDPKLVAHQLSLNAWRHDLVALYLSLIVSAFIAGQLRNEFERRRLQGSSLNS